MRKFFVFILILLGLLIVVLGVMYYQDLRSAEDKAINNKEVSEPITNKEESEQNTYNVTSSLEPISDVEDVVSTSSQEKELETTDKKEVSKAGIVVLNGSGQAGAAGKIAEMLETADFMVIKTGNADSFDYQYTRLLYAEGYEQAASEIEELFSSEVERQLVADQEEDIIIIVGKEN